MRKNPHSNGLRYINRRPPVNDGASRLRPAPPVKPPPKPVSNVEKKAIDVKEIRLLADSYQNRRPPIPPAPGTTLRRLTAEEKANFNEVEIEIYSKWVSFLSVGLLCCFIMFIIFALGSWLGGVKFILGLPFIIYIGVWVHADNKFKGKLNNLVYARQHVRNDE